MAKATWKLLGSAVMAAVLLSGCGTAMAGLGTQQNAAALAAMAKRKAAAAKFGLGARLDGRPKVTYDESTSRSAKEDEMQDVQAFGKALPAKVDLRPNFQPVYNQGTLGSCTAFAIAKGMAEYLLKRENRHTELSALAFYYLERKEDGTVNEDSGAYISTGMKVLDNLGAPPESALPYPAPSLWENAEKMRAAMLQKPTSAMIGAGKSFRVAGTKPVTSLRGIRKALSDGLPVALGIPVFPSFYEPKAGLVPMPDLNKEENQGGHAVLCVGYDNTRKVLIMRNSWGKDWGASGYFYLPYGYVKAGMVMDAWAPKLSN